MTLPEPPLIDPLNAGGPTKETWFNYFGENYEVLKKIDPALLDPSEIVRTNSTGNLASFLDMTEVYSGLNDNQPVDTDPNGSLVSRNQTYTTTSSATLETFITAIGATPATLIIADTQTLTANLTVPSTVRLVISKPGAIAGAFTLTVNGPLDAGIYQIFSSSTTVVLGSYVLECYPEWWGAVGDGATDDTTPISSALTTNIPVVFQSDVTYAMGSGVSVNGSVSMRSSGVIPAILAPTANFKAFSFAAAASATASTTVNGEVEMDDEGITVTDGTGIVAGQLLTMKSNALWYWDNRGSLTKGETHLVKSVSGNVVKFTEPCCDNYATSETVTVSAVNPVSCNITNIKIIPTTQSSNIIIGMVWYVDSVVDGLEVANSDSAGIAVGLDYNSRFINCKVNLNADIDVGLGYGLQTSGSAFCKVLNSDFTNCRRGVDFSGSYPTRFSSVVGCSVTHETESVNASGLGMHGTAENCLFANNILHGLRIGIASRGGNIAIIGNTFTGNGQQAIFSSYGNNLYIANNFVSGPAARTELTTGLGNFSYVTFFEVSSTFDAGGKITLVNNTVQAIQGRFFWASATGADLKVFANGNRCEFYRASAGSAVYYFDGTDMDWSSSKVSNNWFNKEYGGTVNYFGSGATNTPTDNSILRMDGVGQQDSGCTIDDNDTIKSVGGRIVNTTRITGATTLDATHHAVFADSDGSAYTVTLPAGVDGTVYEIANTGSSGNDITVAANGAETINGDASQVLSDGEAIQIVYETTEKWRIF